MIVDTMTFEEIAKYLWRTAFNRSTDDFIKSFIKRNSKKYSRSIKQWLREKDDDSQLILDNASYKGNNEERTYITFFSNSRDYTDYVAFAIFVYKNTKYVAMQLQHTNEVAFYTWHCLHRYAERFLDDKDAVIDERFIGDMLSYNTYCSLCEYNYKGTATTMAVTTDGSFLGDVIGGYFIARTFISQKEYFESQAEIDRVKVFDVEYHHQSVWGYDLKRV